MRQAPRKNREKKEAVARPDTMQTILPKVQSQSVQGIVYKELESAILSGKIPPGQKLVTEEISRMMDVSRIPVREAMGVWKQGA